MAIRETLARQAEVSAETARQVADDFALKNAGDLVGAGQPQRAVSPLGSVWTVPLILSNASSGPVGVVGVVVVDDRLGQIVASTPKEEIQSAATQVFDSKSKDIWAAFRAALAAAQT